MMDRMTCIQAILLGINGLKVSFLVSLILDIVHIGNRSLKSL